MSQVLRRFRFESGGSVCCRNISFNRSLLKENSLSLGFIVEKTLLRPSNSQIFLRNSNGSQRSMSLVPKFLRRNKKDDDEESIPDVKSFPLLEEEPKQLTEEELAAKRDVSRLNPNHRRLVHGTMPYPEPKVWFHHTVRYKQRMYALYGESSGVNPGIIWPTQEELQDKREFESVQNPFTIQELVEKKQAERKREKAELDARVKDIEAKMQKIDEYKADLERRQKDKEREMSKAKARREKLVEEVRRHFGYTVDPKDERFQELLEKKEREDKKKQKEARKLERQQKLLDKLQGKEAKEIKAIPKVKKGPTPIDDDGTDDDKEK